jgi:parvulin-like peptidyl-prolyl isomerase
MSKHQKKKTISADRQEKTPWYRSIRNIIIIVVAAVIIAAGGWSIYYFPSRPYREAAIQVNDTVLDMGYFINMLKLYYGNAPSGTTITDYADYVEQQIMKGEKIILGSQALGVEIPRSDIEKKLADAGKAVTRESVDLLMAQELILKQMPTTQPQYQVQAMLLESETAAQAAIARLNAGEAFATVSSQLSKYPSGAINPDTIGWVTPRQADLSLSSAEFGNMIANTGVGTISGPVYDDSIVKNYGYWVAQMVETRYESDNITLSVRVQGILVGTEQEAKEILEKIKAGADINELAKQSSQITGTAENGANLGWVLEKLEPSLFDALSTGPMNTAIGPISDNLTQTKGGYWVCTVLEKNENMELSDEQLSTLQDDLLERCTAALEKNPAYQMKSLMTPEMKEFALNEAVLAQGSGSVLIATNSLPIGEAGLDYYCKLKVHGEQNGNTWSISGGRLPDGITLDTVNGVISGIPQQGGGGGVTIKVENSLHFNTVDLSYTIYIPISITTTSLPDGQTGTDYSQTLDALSGIQYPAWTVVKGSLPDGLTLVKGTGLIRGTPTAAGSFSFTVQADDGLKQTTQDLTINIK